MKYYYDLHIHSALSPCADILMTPNNITNMASLKGLDYIAITDHNSLKQLPVIHEICLSYNLILIYGVEVTVKEDFHVLCYFKTLEDAMRFDEELETYAIHETYDSRVLGDQVITDIEDYTVKVLPFYLGRPLDLEFIMLIEILQKYNHLRFLAHIDRDMYSGLKYYEPGMMNGVECTKHVSKEFLKKYLSNEKHILYNSDAHQLTDILERESNNVIDLDEKSIDAFFKAFQNG
ncbi:MAG: PHP domain-containing protein [Candidatus Izemoplasmatales bacterium]|jgi:hypothetical protein|nr:PHP domain-containing protein [Candidatus Izemoplasmatales bacterium]